MKLIPISTESVPIAEPLPFALLDAGGILLAKKGYVIAQREELTEMHSTGRGLFADEADKNLRPYFNKLYGMVRDGKELRQIAGAIIPSVAPAEPETESALPDWLDLQTQANTLLRDPASEHFHSRLNRLCAQLRRFAHANPDGTLFALFHLSASEIRLYSATHAMLVAVIGQVAAREVLDWPSELQEALFKAALTMNIGMTELQDQLAQQLAPVTPTQRKQIDTHARYSVHLLRQAGVHDSIWLDAVRDHHDIGVGPLSGKTPAQRVARLIQRADMFAARLAPRAARVPIAPAAAMQAIYFDENRQVDEAGAALIKAMGIYSPGSFVRLATNEVAVVARRGLNTTTPRVAVLINREGMPMAEPVIRDTGLREFRVVASVAHRDVKIQLNLQRMLPLTAGIGAERPW